MDEKLHVQALKVGLLGTQCYVIWRENEPECVVIDPGDEPERIRAACGGRRIAAMMLTHGHFDHIGGVSALAEAGTEIVIHRLDAPLLRDPVGNVSGMVGRRITAPEATRLVEEGDTVTAAGMAFRVMHTPGHTPGSVCYEAGACLFSGDTLFHAGYGRTDLPGGDEAAMAASLRRLAPMRATHVLYPGH